MDADDLWTRGRAISQVGEFDLIERLRATADGLSNPAILLGIGDDAAILQLEGMDTVVTCDIQIEGRHFRREWLTPEEAGARAATVNLSDIAAMGALPVAALVSLGVPPNLSLEAIERLYAGLLRALGEHGAGLAGGNVTGADQLILDITLIGQVERGRALRRSGVCTGDVVFVTGRPGRAAAALWLLANGPDVSARLGELHGESPADLRARLRPSYSVPVARIAVGRHLLLNEIASAAIDQSDGVAGDMMHLCEQSRIAIVLEEEHLPIDEDLLRLSELIDHDPLEWVLGASDDYELLFTAPLDRVDDVFAMAAALQTAVSPIGWVEDGEPRVRLRKRDGRLVALSGGWDHLQTMRKDPR